MGLDKGTTKRVLSLLNAQKLAVMATYEPKQPYLSLVAFCHTSDLKRIIFATDRNTRKYENLMKNSRAAILFDNRIVAESDFHLGVAVTAYGNAEEVEESNISKLREYYLEKHPAMEDFLDSTTTALLCLNVEYFHIVDNFQDVTVVTVN